MSGSQDADKHNGEPRRVEGVAQRLCKQSGQGEEGKDEHGAHTTCVGVHAMVDEVVGQLAAYDAEHRDEVEHEDAKHTHVIGWLDAELRFQILRRPEEEEPPHAIGHKLAEDERPCLAIGEAFEEWYLRSFVVSLCRVVLGVGILVDVSELGLVDV